MCRKVDIRMEGATCVLPAISSYIYVKLEGMVPGLIFGGFLWNYLSHLFIGLRIFVLFMGGFKGTKNILSGYNGMTHGTSPFKLLSFDDNQVIPNH